MKTGDTSVTPGKTYYTESSGTYTKVASPSAGSLSNYYELVGAGAPINFMVVERSAVIKFDKHVASRVFSPDELENLDSYMMKAKRSPANYNKGSIQAGTYNAKTYALPLYPDFGVIYFRSDIVSEEDAAKLRSGDFTWDDLLAMAETYKGQAEPRPDLLSRRISMKDLSATQTSILLTLQM